MKGVLYRVFSIERRNRGSRASHGDRFLITHCRDIAGIILVLRVTFFRIRVHTRLCNSVAFLRSREHTRLHKDYVRSQTV